MGDEHKLYNEYFFPNKLRKIKVSRVKKEGQTADAYSYLAVGHSLESRKNHTDHYIIRFDQNLKMKRQYHISEILGVQPDYENNCLTLIFHNHHSIRGALLNSAEKESREFYFKSKKELSEFTQEVQKSVIDTEKVCNKEHLFLHFYLKKKEIAVSRSLGDNMFSIFK